MTDRPFRRPESIVAERVTRDMLPAFLQRKGLANLRDSRTPHGASQSQAISAMLPAGGEACMSVRICWHDEPGTRTYSAAQLMATVNGLDWEGSIRAKLDRERSRGVTHLLLVQRQKSEITSAALIPLGAVLPIWHRQREISERLIREGRFGRRTKNHAMNGTSPTIYIRDDRAEDVAAVLWSHPGVTDLARLPDCYPTEMAGPHGGGFGDPSRNRMVEDAATGLIRRRYEREGWIVQSKERERCGFDLECRRQRETRHVEVKGTNGIAKSFMLTAGELNCATHDPLFHLVLVTAALSPEPQVWEYRGNAFLESFRITPVQFRAQIETEVNASASPADAETRAFPKSR